MARPCPEYFIDSDRLGLYAQIIAILPNSDLMGMAAAQAVPHKALWKALADIDLQHIVAAATPTAKVRMLQDIAHGSAANWKIGSMRPLQF